MKSGMMFVVALSLGLVSCEPEAAVAPEMVIEATTEGLIEQDTLAISESADTAEDARELGKKHGRHGGFVQPIVVAAPQKKMPVVQPTKKGGYGGYGFNGGYGYGGYGGRWLAEEDAAVEVAVAAIEATEDSRELGKKHGRHGGYAQPIIVAAPQKKMPVVQPTKKGGYGGYGYGGYGYGGYGGRWLAEEDEAIAEIEAAEEDIAEESRELGKKHGRYGGYAQPIIVAAPQKKMPVVQPTKKGGYGGYGFGGYGGYGYGGHGRWLAEENVDLAEDTAEADLAEGEARELGKKHRHYGGYAQPIIVAAPQKKMPVVQPTKKGGYGGYGYGNGYGYGGYGRRWLVEEEESDEELLEAEARELGKKHGHHGGYARPVVVVAAPQKKMPVARPTKKGGYGGFGGYAGYGGYGRWLGEVDEEILEDSEEERALSRMPPTKMPAPVKRPPVKAQPVVTKKHTYVPHTKAPPAKVVRPVQKKQPMPVYTKRPVQYHAYHGKSGF